MARKCFMCGCEITEGILCEKCDKPRRKSAPPAAATTPNHEPAAERATPSVAAPQSSSPRRSDSGRFASAEAALAAVQHESDHERDPFPKAPVVQFPVGSASPAVTSVVDLLVASGVAAVLVAPDRTVKFVSDQAVRLFDATPAELTSLPFIEQRAGIRVGDLSAAVSTGVRIVNRNYIYTVVPMSGGAGGAVLIFRAADPLNEAHASFVTYVRETVLGPLKGLRDSMRAIGESRNDHFLSDSAAGLDQVLSSLELAPEVEEHNYAARPVPAVPEVVRRVAERFRAHADLKGIRLDVDVQDLQERFADHEQLAEALAILMDNALHYVPAGGQVVIGVRWMEHKGKPLLLFFVMDNGAVVPESLRQAIFEPSFVWNPSSPERTGRGLFKCREFAAAHAGSLWVESKTGKACTFFLRVRPDGVR